MGKDILISFNYARMTNYYEDLLKIPYLTHEAKSLNASTNISNEHFEIINS